MSFNIAWIINHQLGRMLTFGLKNAANVSKQFPSNTSSRHRTTLVFSRTCVYPLFNIHSLLAPLAFNI